jgi:hypothetical protein
MVCGTLDQCYRQITNFIEYIWRVRLAGGKPAGHGAGFLSHAAAVDRSPARKADHAAA